MRWKIGALEEAFTGHFTDNHAFLLGKMLSRVDAIDADIADLDARIEQMIAPARAARRIAEIPSIGCAAAAIIIAEISADMTRFPTAGHLASWAKFTPRETESAGKKERQGLHRARQLYLARVLGESAVAASRTASFPGERYRRIAHRRGSKESHRRRPPDPPGHHLAPALRARSPLQRPWPRLIRSAHPSRAAQASSRPPARSPRLQGHPRTRRLTCILTISRLRCAAPGAAACPVTQ
jgi:hypothetical protein